MFLIFVYLLPSFIIDRSHNILSLNAKSAIEHILMSEYGFTASKVFSAKF